MRANISIFISGKVQGVFFRASAKEKADELGIAGFVRNQSDGSVYIEAEGDEDQLHKLKAWCQTGPPRAQVESVRIHEGELQHFSQFSIQR